MRETYAAIGGTSETATSAKSSFARIFIVPHRRAPDFASSYPAPQDSTTNYILDLVRGKLFLQLDNWRGFVVHGGLRRLVEAGFAKRIMLAPMKWYGLKTIRIAIDRIESEDILSEEQKRDISYNKQRASCARRQGHPQNSE